jgi:hypothetical protein
LIVFLIKKHMQLINLTMINNTKKTAEYKLNRHKKAGNNSNLTILDVANLMDVIKHSEEMSQDSIQHSIFHSLAYN